MYMFKRSFCLFLGLCVLEALSLSAQEQPLKIKFCSRALLDAAVYMDSRWMLQVEYYFDCLNRTGDNRAYHPHGGYIQGGFLLKGRGFACDAMYGIPGRPVSPQAIELVARLNYTDMNNGKAGIY